MLRILIMRHDGAIASRCACGFQSACGLHFDPRARHWPSIWVKMKASKV